MYEQPVTFDFDMVTGLCMQQPGMVRHLSYMKDMFTDEQAFEELVKENPLIYTFYDMAAPATSLDLAFGTSICQPGKVGQEYFMTKGHYHEVFGTAEVYYCLQGGGLMMMETPEGLWCVKELVPGRMIYVPGGWAHRTINTGTQPFITFYVFRGDAGHDYATIEDKSFRKMVVEEDGSPVVVDNPRWKQSQI